MAPDSTLSNLRRRLDRWELQHLRSLAAELKERLDRAEEERDQAWRSAEFWQQNAMNLQAELVEAGETVGLTQQGELVRTPEKQSESPLMAWARLIADWIEDQDGPFSIDDVAKATGVQNLSSDLRTRIGIVLRKLGCTKHAIKGSYVYRKDQLTTAPHSAPSQEKSSSATAPADQAMHQHQDHQSDYQAHLRVVQHPADQPAHQSGG